MPTLTMGSFPEEVGCVNGGVEMHSGGQSLMVPTFGRSDSSLDIFQPPLGQVSKTVDLIPVFAHLVINT